MLLTFQMMLERAGIEPAEVRLIRHVKRPKDRGLSPYQAWRENRRIFEEYQSTQIVKDRRYFSAPYWAAFVATPTKETLFVGLYAAELVEAGVAAFTCPLTGFENETGKVDRYKTSTVETFAPYEGKLIVD